MTEPKEINERKEQLNKEAMNGITQSFQMVDKAVRLFIDSKVKAGVPEVEAMQMAHAGVMHAIANMMAYSYVHKYIPDLELAINNTAISLADSVIEILKAHEKKGDKKIILPEGD